MKGMMVSRFSIVGPVLFAALFICCARFALAQGTAAMSGRVEDASGAAIGGATVTVVSEETGANRSTTTEEDGQYRVLALPVGRYDIRAEKAGFKTQAQTGVTLVVGQQAVVNVKLD